MERLFGCPGQLKNGLGCKLTERVVLDVSPDVFGRIDFRGIGGKVMKGYSFVALDEAFDFFGSMGGEPVPEDDDVSPDVESELMKKIEAAGRGDVNVLEEAEIKGRFLTLFQTKCSDDGDFFQVAAASVKDGGFPLGRPGSSDKRRHEDAGFVNEGKGCPVLEGFFLMRGQV